MGSSFSYLIRFIRFKKQNNNNVIDNQKAVNSVDEKKESDESFSPQIHFMENMADDFMKQTAFSRTAEIYGLHDDLIADDLPLEDSNTTSSLDSDDISLEEDELLLQSKVLSISNDTIIRWKKGVLIGSGSFGTVYLAVNLDNGELFAVKQLELNPHRLIEQEAEVQSLQHEISVLRTLKHKNIVQYLGSNVENNTINIFLEYVPGGSILSLTKKFGHLPENIIRLYTTQILEGLVYLHKHNIVHRDIKGANILVTEKGVIKLADFGASKRFVNLVSHAGANDGVNSLKGTTYWMAPEVIKQDGCDIKADIWSLGCTVIEMATGKPPWMDDFTEQISAMYSIATSEELPPLPDTLSPSAKDFLSKCFIRNPRERPSAEILLKHQWICNDNSDEDILFNNNEIIDDYNLKYV